MIYMGIEPLLWFELSEPDMGIEPICSIMAAAALEKSAPFISDLKAGSPRTGMYGMHPIGWNPPAKDAGLGPGSRN